VPEPSAFQVEMAIEKLKGHKELSIDRIAAECIKSGDNKLAINPQTY
jgi:hypothetical protein